VIAHYVGNAKDCAFADIAAASRAAVAPARNRHILPDGASTGLAYRNMIDSCRALHDAPPAWPRWKMMQHQQQRIMENE
jgi:hypothetical protein